MKKKLAISGFSIETEKMKIGEELGQFILSHIDIAELEGSVLCIATKLFSLAESRLLKISDVSSKKDLIIQESDVYLGEIEYGCHLSIKEGLLLPSAGIDESNSPNGDYILYPKDPKKSLIQLYEFLENELSLELSNSGIKKNPSFGLLMVDSHTKPLRRGVVGAAVCGKGFSPIEDHVGQLDLFGRELKMTRINVADALAQTGVFLMGEGNDQTPLVLLKAPRVKFGECDWDELWSIPLKEDLYRPLLEKSMKTDV